MVGLSSINLATLAGIYFRSFSLMHGYMMSDCKSSHAFGVKYFHIFPITIAKRPEFLFPIFFSENCTNSNIDLAGYTFPSYIIASLIESTFI